MRERPTRWVLLYRLLNGLDERLDHRWFWFCQLCAHDWWGWVPDDAPR